MSEAKRVRMPKFQVWRVPSTGQYTFRLVSATGRVMNHHYRDTTDAVRGIEDFKEAAKSATVVFLDAPPSQSGRVPAVETPPLPDETDPEPDPNVDLVLP